MPVVSSIFLVIALVLAVVLGPQTRAWTWGPAMVALGFASCTALPMLWRKSRDSVDLWLVFTGFVVAIWFAGRAWLSPVAEGGQADLILLVTAIATFICLRGIEGNRAAGSILAWGIALLLLADQIVIWKQVQNATFSPVFGGRTGGFPSGFYAQYNNAANFLFTSSLLLAGNALFRKQMPWVRIVWLLISTGGFVAVYFTRSRGGILGSAVGLGVFAAIALLIGQKNKAKWFAPAIIAIPLLGILIAGFLYLGWSGSQAIRMGTPDAGINNGLGQVLDNDSRLYMLGMAISCVGLHPFAGGGSRSFSWESFRFAEGKSQGDIITHLPDMVHNEIVQSVTDYGIIGAGLLIGLLATLAITAIVRILFPNRENGVADSGDAWRIGGLAALAGMLTQSCFSFVFHLMPGCILLGICLGQISHSTGRPAKTISVFGWKALLSLTAAACAVFLLTVGWKGMEVTRILWPTYFSKQPLVSTESRIEALTGAIRIWPQPSLYQDRATAFQEAAAEVDQEDATAMARSALSDQEAASFLNPHDPKPAINRANLLSRLGEDAKAEDAYQLGIRLQGGMEPAFRAHLLFAQHLLRKGRREFEAEDPTQPIATLQAASDQLDEALAGMHWALRDMDEARVAIPESLGAAHEMAGNYQEAMRHYELAIATPTGERVIYRASQLDTKLANIAWKARKPGQAMWYFTEAKLRANPGSLLPPDVTPSQRTEYIAYLDKAIAFLRGAHVQAEKPTD